MFALDNVEEREMEKSADWSQPMGSKQKKNEK